MKHVHDCHPLRDGALSLDRFDGLTVFLRSAYFFTVVFGEIKEEIYE
jgi:hypothetical protein